MPNMDPNRPDFPQTKKIALAKGLRRASVEEVTKYKKHGQGHIHTHPNDEGDWCYTGPCEPDQQARLICYLSETGCDDCFWDPDICEEGARIKDRPPQAQLFSFQYYKGDGFVYMRFDRAHPTPIVGDEIISIPANLRPYHLQGDDAKPSMPAILPGWTPPVPTNLLVISNNEHNYVANHGDLSPVITYARYDLATSTIRIKYTTSKNIFQVHTTDGVQIAEVRVRLDVAFYLIESTLRRIPIANI
jgi:hypothetical protein